MFNRKNVAALALILGLQFACADQASAEFVVTMTGTIQQGTLNGASLDERDFVMTATIASPVDLATTENDYGALADETGLFLGDQAVMRFDVTSQFVFDPGSLAFGLLLDLSGSELHSFAAGFVGYTEDGPSSNQFSFTKYGHPAFTPPLPEGFNPNIVTPFSYGDFDSAIANGEGEGLSQVARFSNAAGDVIEINYNALLPGSLTIVPEPSALALAALGLFGLVVRLRRPQPIPRTGGNGGNGGFNGKRNTRLRLNSISRRAPARGYATIPAASAVRLIV